MPIVPPPQRVEKQDDDVNPARPFGPPKEWPDTYELMVGVGEIKDMTPADDTIWLEYEPIKHLHPGPLGFVDVRSTFPD